MAAYSYAPPPPPPPPAASNSSQQQNYGHRSNSHGSNRGGGPSGRGGRGGGGGGGHHNSRQGYQQHPSPSNQPPTAYEYPGQAYPQGGHAAAAAYGAGNQHPPPGSYNPSHQPAWTPEHAHQAPPQPGTAAAYHPGYHQQAYAQHQAQAAYNLPPSYSSSLPYQAQAPTPGAPSHWNASQPSSYGGRGGRGRGGYTDRGGHGGSVPVADFSQGMGWSEVNQGWNQQYAPDHHHASHSPPAPYQYGAPPQPPPFGRQDGYHGHNQRGRGGPRGRGRGGPHAGDRPRHQNKGQPTDHQGKQHGKQANQQKPKPDGQGNGKKKKRKTNTLGLTPGNNSDTEDDEDEEVKLAERLGGDAYVPKDIADYIATRKKNFPTRAKKTAELVEKAKKLKEELDSIELSIKRKREEGDEGDEMRDSSAKSPTSSNGPPEVMSSAQVKVKTDTEKKPPVDAAAAASTGKKTTDLSNHCKYYSTGGICGKKAKCRFVHDDEVRTKAIKEIEENGGNITLGERFKQSEMDWQDTTIIQTIQYLKSKGRLKNHVPASIKTEPDTKQAVPKKPNSLLPAPPASLPPLPIKREPASLPRRKHANNSQANNHSFRNNNNNTTQPPPSTTQSQSVIVPNVESGNTQEQPQGQTQGQTQDEPYKDGWLENQIGSSDGTISKSDNLP